MGHTGEQGRRKDSFQLVVKRDLCPAGNSGVCEQAAEEKIVSVLDLKCDLCPAGAGSVCGAGRGARQTAEERANQLCRLD